MKILVELAENILEFLLCVGGKKYSANDCGFHLELGSTSK